MYQARLFRQLCNIRSSLQILCLPLFVVIGEPSIKRLGCWHRLLLMHPVVVAHNATTSLEIVLVGFCNLSAFSELLNMSDPM